MLRLCRSGQYRMIVESSCICRGLHFFRYEIRTVAPTAGFEAPRTNLGSYVMKRRISFVIAAGTVGFTAQIYGSATKIENDVSNIDERVSAIQTTVSAQDSALARSIATLRDILEAAIRDWRDSARLHERGYRTLRTKLDTLFTEIVTIHDSLKAMSQRVRVIEDSLTIKAERIERSVDTLRDTIQELSKRFAQKAASLWDSQDFRVSLLQEIQNREFSRYRQNPQC